MNGMSNVKVISYGSLRYFMHGLTTQNGLSSKSATSLL